MLNEIKKIAILTSKESWFIPYAKELVRKIQKNGYSVKLFNSHEGIPKRYSIVFILSYFRVIEEKYLKSREHNLVVHESDLPKGRGWAPLFWQIIEGKNKIPIVLFEATKDLDAGEIYLKDEICLSGLELHDSIRKLQVDSTISLCLRFLMDYNKLKPEKQKGEKTNYKKRSPNDSKLDINKSIKSQFNLFRTVNNEKYPGFFEYKGKKYLLKIFEDDKKL